MSADKGTFLTPLCVVPGQGSSVVVLQMQRYAPCFLNETDSRPALLPAEGQMYLADLVDLSLTGIRTFGSPEAVTSLDYCRVSGRLYGHSVVPAREGCVPDLLHWSSNSDGTARSLYVSGHPYMMRFGGGLYAWEGSVLSERHGDQAVSHDLGVKVARASRTCDGSYLLLASPSWAPAVARAGIYNVFNVASPVDGSEVLHYCPETRRLRKAFTKDGPSVRARAAVMLPGDALLVTFNSLYEMGMTSHPLRVLSDVVWEDVNLPPSTVPGAVRETAHKSTAAPVRWRKQAELFFVGKEVPEDLMDLRRQYDSEPLDDNCTQCERNALDSRYMKKIKALYERPAD